jgi:hypothetical protein
VSLGESDAPRGMLSRAIHHLRTLGPTLAEGVEWWRIQQRARSVTDEAEAHPVARGI